MEWKNREPLVMGYGLWTIGFQVMKNGVKVLPATYHLLPITWAAGPFSH
jgi:hypothetical protein